MSDNYQDGGGELVLVGAASGGVEALIALVGSLPKDFSIPIVVLLNSDGNRTAQLLENLERISPLPIIHVTSRTKIEPGNIYLITGHRPASITDHFISIKRDQGLNNNIDALFTTAARIFRDRLIAVVLAGSGTDGAAGGVDVKANGGMVIIQNPHTARQPSMPLSLPPTAVDFVVDAEQVGALLSDLARGIALPQAPEKLDETLRLILERVTDVVKIDFSNYKPTTIKRRIGRRMVITRNFTLEEYASYLESHSDEVIELARTFLIKVTHFFRDTEAFEFIEKNILPRLLEHGYERGRNLRLWSAGCATGEEPYSLAMLIANLLGAELPEWNIKIFATDLDGAAIDFARRGLYCESVIRDVPKPYIDRYFEPVDGMYRISKVLRQMVIFGQQDLSWSAPFPRIDLVSCRNLLIYFKPDLQERVLDLFNYSLRQGGYLFLGKAETAWPINPNFEQINKKWKIYRCVHNAFTPPQRLDAVGGKNLNSAARYQTAAPPKLLNKPVNESNTQNELTHWRRFNDAVLRYLPVGLVVIDRNYRLTMVNSPARRLLGLHEATKEQDLLHAVRGIPYLLMRNSIDTVFREHNDVCLYEIELDRATGGDGRYLNFNIVSIPTDQDNSELALITVTDVSEQVNVRDRLERSQEEQAKLVTELASANKRLNESNRAIMDVNERLQAANEEMMLAHEELQATNEEFETTNEELQATNEELETNNEELHATNEELEATNQELSNRTNELQELARRLSAERLRLTRMVELSPFYVMVLRGPHLIIETLSPLYAKIVGERQILGRPFTEVFRAAEFTEFVKLVQDTYIKGKERTSEEMITLVKEERGKKNEYYFVYTIIPTHESSGEIDGLIVYASDVTVQHELEAKEELTRLKVIIEHCEPSALGLFDAKTERLLQASPLYLDAIEQGYGMKRENIMGAKWSEISLPATGPEAVKYFKSVVKNRNTLRLPEYRCPLPGPLQDSLWDWGLKPVIDNNNKDEIRYIVFSAVELLRPRKPTKN